MKENKIYDKVVCETMDDMDEEMEMLSEATMKDSEDFQTSKNIENLNNKIIDRLNDILNNKDENAAVKQAFELQDMIDKINKNNKANNIDHIIDAKVATRNYTEDPNKSKGRNLKEIAQNNKNLKIKEDFNKIKNLETIQSFKKELDDLGIKVTKTNVPIKEYKISDDLFNSLKERMDKLENKQKETEKKIEENPIIDNPSKVLEEMSKDKKVRNPALDNKPKFEIASGSNSTFTLTGDAILGSSAIHDGYMRAATTFPSNITYIPLPYTTTSTSSGIYIDPTYNERISKLEKENEELKFKLIDKTIHIASDEDKEWYFEKAITQGKVLSIKDNFINDCFSNATEFIKKKYSNTFITMFLHLTEELFSKNELKEEHIFNLILKNIIHLYRLEKYLDKSNTDKLKENINQLIINNFYSIMRLSLFLNESAMEYFIENSIYKKIDTQTLLENFWKLKEAENRLTDHPNEIAKYLDTFDFNNFTEQFDTDSCIEYMLHSSNQRNIECLSFYILNKIENVDIFPDYTLRHIRLLFNNIKDSNNVDFIVDRLNILIENNKINKLHIDNIKNIIKFLEYRKENFNNDLIEKTLQNFYKKYPEENTNKSTNWLKENAEKGIYQGLATLAIDNLTNLFILALEKQNLEKDSLDKIKNILESNVGKSLLSGMIGAGIHFAPIDQVVNNEKIQKIADKCVENATAKGVVEINNFVMDFIMPALTNTLQNNKQVRVSTIKEETKQEDKEDILDEYFQLENILMQSK